VGHWWWLIPFFVSSIADFYIEQRLYDPDDARFPPPAHQRELHLQPRPALIFKYTT
jgi:hypothetical protein